MTLRQTTDRQRLVGVYRRIYSGEIRAVGHDGSAGIGGLQFKADEIEGQLPSGQALVSLTIEQVSQLTSAHYDAVKGWIADGLLLASRDQASRGSDWRVEWQALVTFLMTYTPLATLAKQAHTTSRGLETKLSNAGVTVITPGAGRGAVVKISDIVSVL